MSSVIPFIERADHRRDRAARIIHDKGAPRTLAIDELTTSFLVPGDPRLISTRKTPIYPRAASRAREDRYWGCTERVGRDGYPQLASPRPRARRFPSLPLPGLSPLQHGQPRPAHLVLRVWMPPFLVARFRHRALDLVLLAVPLMNRRVRTLQHRLQPGLGGHTCAHRAYGKWAPQSVSVRLPALRHQISSGCTNNSTKKTPMNEERAYNPPARPT